MAIVKRLTKGSALTHAELDGNFTDLDGRVGTLESTADSDNQTLTLTGDTLSISGGNSVDLSKYTDAVFSGDYDDLTNKPTIPTDVSDLTDATNLFFDRSYNSLTDTPTIPADVSDLTDTGNLLGPDNELVGTAVPEVGGTALANETGITYSNKIAIFTEGAFTVGVWTDVQVGWTVTDNNGFTDTIASRGGFGAASFVTTVNNWPAPASGKTYVFTSPDYQPESVNPVEITVGNNDWLFNNNGSVTFPDATVQTTAYPGPPTGFFNTGTNGDTGAFVLPGGNVVFQIDGVAPVAVVTSVGLDVNKITTGASEGGDNLTIVTNAGGNINIDGGTTGIVSMASQSGGLSIGRVGGSSDVYGEVEFNNGTTLFQPGNSVSFNGPVNFASATVTGLQSIVQSQIVGVNNFSTTISQDQWYTKFAKVDIIGDGFGGTSTDTYEIRLGNNRLQFENNVVGTDAYVQNSTPSGSLYINAGAGTVVTGGMGGDLYLSGGERTFGSVIGGNVFVNSNGGDIFIGQLANTAEIRIGGGPDYAGQNPTTFYGDVNFASGKSVTFTGATITGLPATDYGDITNTPTIPADVSDLTDTGNLLFSGNYGDLTGKPSNGGVAYQFGYSAHNAVGTSPFGEFTVNSVPMIISVTATANVQGARIEISGITASTSAGTGLITVQRRLNGGGWLVWSSFIVDGALDHFNHSFIDFYDTAVASNDVSAGDSVEYRLVNATADNTNYPGSTADTVEFELFLGFQFTATEIPVSFGLTQPGV